MAMKKIPQRMCIACRARKDKHELLRVVRTPAATVEIDRTGKKAGRGVYICHDPQCLARAVKTKALERALRVPVPATLVEELRQAIVR